MHVTLMHNPTAGEEEHSREALVAALEDAGHEVRYQATGEDGWRAALDEPTELVVAAGGDGTVRRVFLALRGRGLLATLIPLGSANNIARTLGLADRDAASLARGWAAASRRLFDIGTLRSVRDEVHFVESVGGGLFAELLVRAERAAEDPSGAEREDHGLSLLASVLAEIPARRWGLSLDGIDVSGDYIAVEVMNIREIGPNLGIAAGAAPGDGIVDVVLIGAEHRAGLQEVVRARLDDRPAAEPSLRVARGRSLDIDPPPGAPLHVDDALWEGPPSPNPGRAAVRIGRDRLDLIVPA